MRRTFVYRLRARSAEVLRVPGFKFVYYNPAVANVNHGYQTTIAPSVSILVRSRQVAASATDDTLARRVNDLRRGLMADPSSKKLHAELEIARSEVPYPEADMRPSGNRWRYWLPPAGLGAVAVGGCLLGGAALVRWRNVRAPVWLFTAMLAFLVAMVSAVGRVVDSRQRSNDESSTPVVLKATTELRRGNGPDYPKRIETPLPAGVEARRLFERGDWLQVELANGIVGWVPRESAFAD